MSERNILSQICKYKRQEVEVKKASLPLADLKSLIDDQPPARGFEHHIQKRIAMGLPALIAEVKKASPSHGLIREDFDPATIAKAYEQGGATCLSVLTDEHYFQGHNDYLKQAKQAVSLPVLRKDFIIDEWQIYEAKSIGADCVLLILSALDQAQAEDFAKLSRMLGMDVLIETHDADEVKRALQIDQGIIGINNRNLNTLEVDLNVTEQLIPAIPDHRIMISESGLCTAKQIYHLMNLGVSGFLVGEALMKQPDITLATQSLLQQAQA